jgi:hypothetical protein
VCVLSSSSTNSEHERECHAHQNSQLTDRQGKWGPDPTHWRSASVGGKGEDLLPGAAQLVLVRLRRSAAIIGAVRSDYWFGYAASIIGAATTYAASIIGAATTAVSRAAYRS